MASWPKVIIAHCLTRTQSSCPFLPHPTLGGNSAVSAQQMGRTESKRATCCDITWCQSLLYSASVMLDHKSRNKIVIPKPWGNKETSSKEPYMKYSLHKDPWIQSWQNTNLSSNKAWGHSRFTNDDLNYYQVLFTSSTLTSHFRKEGLCEIYLTQTTVHKPTFQTICLT